MKAWNWHRDDAGPASGPSIEIRVATFIPRRLQHSPTTLPSPINPPRFPKVAKKTRRLMGLLNEEDRRKVDRMKTIPRSENTEDTLSVTTIIRFCSGVSDGAMLAGLVLLCGLDDCSCRRALSYDVGFLAKRQPGGSSNIPKGLVEGYVGLRFIRRDTPCQDALLCRSLSGTL